MDAIQLQELAPNWTDRVLLVGQTGSGKTTLAQFLLNHRTYRVVADYKGRINWPGYVICNDLKTLIKNDAKSLTYRPDYAESQDDDARERFWEWIYRRENTTAYADEVAAFTTGDRYPYYYGACLSRGRELGVEVWSGTQRPTRIPQIVLSESEHVYAFRLRLPQDRERVEALTGIDRNRIAMLQKQEFLYSRQDADVVGPLRLQGIEQYQPTP